MAVTINGPNAPKAAIVSSTVVIDPAAAPSNATQNVNPVTSTGGSSIGESTGTTYYLTDTPEGQSYAAPSSAHTAHDTVNGSGVPDQLRTDSPGVPASGSPTAVSYSTDSPAADGRRPGPRRQLLLQRIVVDDGAPLGHAGAQRVERRHRDGQRGDVDADIAARGERRRRSPGRMCVRIYSVSLNGSNQVSSETLLGSFAYQLDAWPESTELISFPFRYLATGTTASLAAGKRLMAELTSDSAYSEGLALVYDHPNFPASIQLETQ